MKSTNQRYDLETLPAQRILMNFLRWKVFRFGNFGSGPGIVWLVSIWLRHRFGRAMATLKIKHKKWFDRMISLLSKVRGR